MGKLLESKLGVQLNKSSWRPAILGQSINQRHDLLLIENEISPERNQIPESQSNIENAYFDPEVLPGRGLAETTMKAVRGDDSTCRLEHPCPEARVTWAGHNLPFRHLLSHRCGITGALCATTPESVTPTSGFRCSIRPRVAWRRVLLAVALPLAVFPVQFFFWETLKPLAWFLFYPAVFFAALIGHFWGGLAATGLGTVLVWYYFLPPRFSFAIDSTGDALSVLIFFAAGTAFSIIHERLHKVAIKTAQLIGESRFRSLVDQARDGIVLTDAKGNYLEVNAAFCEMMGRSRAEILDLCVDDLLAKEERPRVRKLFAAGASAEGVLSEWKMLRRDGSIVPVEATIHQGTDGQWSAIVRDITTHRQTTSALQEIADFNQGIIDSVISQVAVLDREGRIIAVNEAWRRFAEANSSCPARLKRTGIGINFLEVCAHCDEGGHATGREVTEGVSAVLAGSREKFQTECSCDTPQELLWFVLNVTPLHTPAGGAVVSYIDISDLKRAQETEHLAAVQLKTLALKQLAFQEDERKTLSRELHDHIGQSLAALQLALDSARRQVVDLPKAGAAISVATAISHDLLDTTRNLSRRLRPPGLDDLGLAASLRWYVDKLPVTGDTAVSLSQDVGNERFPPEIELAGFRLIQEALSNALRHAGATEIIVSLWRQPGTLQISVRDDGRGFDACEADANSRKLQSLGLLGMRERVVGAGGTFRIDSAPGAGTEITASFGIPTLQ